MPLIELLRKHDEGAFRRAVSEAVFQFLMEHDVEGLIGAERLTYRNADRPKRLFWIPWRAVTV